jgi:archaellum component FlaC
MTYLLYFTAIALSAVSAYYSIAGLASIFAAAMIPIMIMGGVLEFAKLVVASWLYRSWKYVPYLMRTYFTIALVILMSLTSMGIFGFLSKAHLDQAVPTGDVATKLEIIDQKIKTEKENVEASRGQLKQMDAQVDQTMSRSEDTKGAERSLQIRRGQQKERATLLTEIGSAQTRIARLNEERAPIAAELRKVEAEVGPIKYIAALLYGDNPDQGILEKAVRIVIIMIVIVFDPLAVLLLMAASMPIKKEEENESPTSSSEESSSEEIDTETSQTEDSKIDRIKERFFERFSKPNQVARIEPAIVASDRVAEYTTVISDDTDPSAGVRVETTDISSTPMGMEEGKDPDWQINPPPAEETSPLYIREVLDTDSAGRLTSPIPPDFIVDWSNKDGKPRAIPKNS